MNFEEKLPGEKGNAKIFREKHTCFVVMVVLDIESMRSKAPEKSNFTVAMRRERGRGESEEKGTPYTYHKPEKDFQFHL